MWTCFKWISLVALVLVCAQAPTLAQSPLPAGTGDAKAERRNVVVRVFVQAPGKGAESKAPAVNRMVLMMRRPSTSLAKPSAPYQIYLQNRTDRSGRVRFRIPGNPVERGTYSDAGFLYVALAHEPDFKAPVTDEQLDLFPHAALDMDDQDSFPARDAEILLSN